MVENNKVNPHLYSQRLGESTSIPLISSVSVPREAFHTLTEEMLLQSVINHLSKDLSKQIGNLIPKGSSPIEFTREVNYEDFTTHYTAKFRVISNEEYSYLKTMESRFLKVVKEITPLLK